MPRDRWLQPVGLVLLSVLLAGAMWVVPYLPTNDGPEWIFAAHLENHYADPGTVYGDVFVPALQFASRGFVVLYAPLEAWFGWARGLQVALSFIALFVAWGFVALVRAVDPERWPLAFLGFPLALSWEFYMGLWSFVLATALGLFLLAFAVRVREPTWKERAILSGLLLLDAVTHVFGCVLTGGALLFLFVARAPRGQRLTEGARVALVGLPAAGVLLASVLVSRGLARSAFAEDFGRFPWRDALAMFPRTLAPGPLWRASFLLLAVALAAGVALARSFRSKTRDVDRGLGLAAALLLVASLVAPFQIPGWQAFSERFVPLGAMLAVAVFPLERLRASTRRWPAPVLLAVSVGSVLASYPFHRRLADLCPDAIAGLAAPVHASGEVLPISIRGTELPVYDRIRAEVPLLAPLLHMDALYAVAHGGVSASYFVGSPAVSPFLLRPATPHPPRPDVEHTMRALNSEPYHHDLAFRQQVDGELASFGVFYEKVEVFGALPEDLAVWRDRGFVADWTLGSALYAHFEPCTLDVTTPALAADPPPTFDVRLGTLAFASGVRVAPTIGADRLAHFEVSPAPCGPVSVHVAWPASADGSVLSCKNADANGDVVATIHRRAHRVTCDPY